MNDTTKSPVPVPNNGEEEKRKLSTWRIVLGVLCTAVIVIITLSYLSKIEHEATEQMRIANKEIEDAQKEQAEAEKEYAKALEKADEDMKKADEEVRKAEETLKEAAREAQGQ